jgi:lysine 2,3-aminomutase
MTHFNHPKELTPESLAACACLADAGFPVMNQTVLLAGVNDDAAVLATLFRGMGELQGRLSGIALPKLICDTPGGLGKVPLGPDYVVGRAPGRTTLRTFRGDRVDYVDPPT